MGYIGGSQSTVVDREISPGLSVREFEWCEHEDASEEAVGATICQVVDFAPLRLSLKRGAFYLSWIPSSSESLSQGEESAASTVDIWDTPKLRKALLAPMGTPISLTIEEAMEIARRAFGSNPELPSGKEYVSKHRSLLGHSILERLKRLYG